MVELKWHDTRIFIFRYLSFYMCLVVMIFFGLRWHKSVHYSPEKLEQMMISVSNQRDKTDDPCRYMIFGDPSAAQSEYIKVRLFCSEGSSAISSMDLRAIKEKTVGGVIRELGRVNGFDVFIDGDTISLGKKNTLKWRCFQNDRLVTDFGVEAVQMATVECRNN